MPGVNQPVDQQFYVRFADLERNVRAIATQQQLTFTDALGELIISLGLIPAGQYASPGQYGIVGWSGATGVPVFFVYDTTIPDGSGRRQTVTGITRDDGTAALQCADLGTVLNHPHQQALQWFDRSGNNVIADDTVSGVGLARPHIPMSMSNTNISTWPATNATTSTQIAGGYAEYQHPKVFFAIQCYAPANVTGNFYLQYNGTTIAQTSVVGGTSGQFYLWSSTVAVPSGLTFGSVYTLGINADVAAGTGTVYAQPYLLQGQGS